MSFLKRIRDRWDAWSGDREMEMQIRRHLSDNGYFGNTAKLSDIRLVAVQRPGWLQVFRFTAEARRRVEVADDAPDPPAVYDTLHGLLRDDARGKDTRIRVFTDAEERRELFERWSDGLLVMRGGRSLAG